MLKKLVLVLSCACAMNTCLANNIADGTVNSFAQISSDILAEV